MLYCEKCRSLVDSVCHIHNAKYLREPQQGDPVLIAELSGITAAMLEGILLDEKVFFFKEGRLGAGMSVWIGSMMESYSFYVPYASYEQAMGLYTLVCEAPQEGESFLPDEETDD